MLALRKPALLLAIEAEWRSHLADGLSRLRRTPAGGVRVGCDLIRAAPERFTLDYLLRRAAFGLSREELEQDAMMAQRHVPPDAQPIFLARSGLAWQIGQARDAAERARLEAELAALGDADTPTAPALRKVLFPLLAARFGAKPASIAGGECELPLGPVGAASLRLWLDFGRRARGVTWAVEVTEAATGRRLGMQSYEGLLGFAVADWNVLRSDTMEPDMALLVERIGEALAIIGSVDW
jgi:hypothetical protein